MHMANELLSVPVATGTLAVAIGSLALVCKKLSRAIITEKIALMGIMGAFVFAAQMVNFQLPAMPGTSAHMVGTVLLAIMLGPHAATVVMSSVVIVQCLIFQDGGLLALGCNIINMALVPAYLGCFLYRILNGRAFAGRRFSAASIIACVISLETAALLVTIEAVLSGVLLVPSRTFIITMLSVHLLIGLTEGLITVVVLGYIRQVRPDLIAAWMPGKARLSKKTALATLLIFAIVTGAGLSLLASDKPDGLQWSYAERPDQPNFVPIISNDSPHTAAVDDLQSKYSLLPGYSARTAPLGKPDKPADEIAAGWTSFAGIAGAVITMGLVWLLARLLRNNKPTQIATADTG